MNSFLGSDLDTETIPLNAEDDDGGSDRRGGETKLGE